MKKYFGKKQYIILAVLMCILLVFAISNVSKRINENSSGRDLNKIVSSLTFEIDASSEEIKQLKDFEPKTSELTHKDAAVYYRNLMKLYMLRGDTDQALLNFVDGQINAEISENYEMAAWIYADAAEIYTDFYNTDLAIQCVDTAILYAKGQEIDPFFYEYCYAMLAEMYAQKGDTDKAVKYLDLSAEKNKMDLEEYQPMDLRRNLVLARVALEREDYAECEKSLNQVNEAMTAMESMPIDILWFSRIYYPYMQLQTKLNLSTGNYVQVVNYLEEMFATGRLYGQIGSLMSSVSEIIATWNDVNPATTGEVAGNDVENYMRKLIMEYPEAFQEKNVTAGEHIYASNMAMIAVFVQKYQVETFYKLVAQGVAIVTLIIVTLIIFLRQSERKGKIDGLTGVWNRKSFDMDYGKLKNGKVAFGMIMFDVDFFKQINDNYGHQSGDDVLRDVSQTTANMLGRSCKIYRYGGDEFCIICKQKNLQQIGDIAEKIRFATESLTWENGMKTSLSMGAAHSDRAGRDVMKAVDDKVYESKEAGRNKVSF